MKQFLTLIALCISAFTFAQTGSVTGTLTDKEYNDEPLAFANVIIKGTTKGTTSDFDGIYILENLEPGEYIIQFSFVGYETQEIPTTIVASETITLNVSMGPSSAKLDEVVIKTTVKRESETALLLEQKKATTIKESIGSERLSKIGVSSAANATTKISGVTQSEGSGEIYIRGLGDRYLSTTMNGLPIPSDDVQNKNIDLGLFSTNMIQNVSISKTYDIASYGDQASGTVDVASKIYSKKGFKVTLGSGMNSNVMGLNGDFKKSIITDDVSLGFHKKQYAVVNLITKQGWDPVETNTHPNLSLTLSGGYKFDILGKEVTVFGAGSYNVSQDFYEGIFKSYRANVLDNSFSDVNQYNTTYNATGYLNTRVKLNDDHKITYTFLGVNNGIDQVYEQGRNTLGFVYDQDPQEEGAFVRDQNFKQTTMFVNQLHGDHRFSDNHQLKWGAGYNFVLAEEPNRIRNEANILDENTVQYAHVGDFQQRKSSQKIEDTEYNAFVKDAIKFGSEDEEGLKPFKLNFGANFRTKERKFNSLFIGVRAKGFQVPDIDSFSDTFTPNNFFNGLSLKEREPDVYFADLNIYSGFASLDFKANNKLSGNFGLRYEVDNIDVEWSVANYVGRYGTTSKSYNNLFPSLNLKYEINETQFLRLAGSLTQTLPEFKEIAPFEYVTPTGRVIKGDPNISKSDVTNIDVKWEFFPENGGLFSATSFYKQIKNPINLTMARGSSGVFQYRNTGDKADVFGLELETRLGLLKNADEDNIIDFNANVTKMWFEQDLYKEFQYNNKSTSGLQGASDLIINSSVSYNNQREHAFIATLSANYASDKIFALGSPEDLEQSDIMFNEEIIEKGFVTLDVILSKAINKNLTIKALAQNILNPVIKQTQEITDIPTGVMTYETVQSYKRGADFSLNLSYKF
jgi:outer membrane receptor protein involved in Fe transport